MLKAWELAGLWKTMKIGGIMKTIPKNSDFPDFTPISPRIWPNFPKILTIFQNSRTYEPLIVEICMTTQIEAKKVYFTDMLSSILQLMPIFFNHRSQTAKKHKISIIGKPGKIGGNLVFFAKKQTFTSKYIF